MPSFKSKDSAAERFRARYEQRTAPAREALRELRLANLRAARGRPGLPVIAPSGCNPQRAMDVSSVFDLRRNTECKKYDECLSHAAKMDWQGFHCEACPLNTDER